MFYACTKHTKIDFHFVREQVATKRLDISSISTTYQIANGSTKTLPEKQMVMFTNNLNLSDELGLTGVLEYLAVGTGNSSVLGR